MREILIAISLLSIKLGDSPVPLSEEQIQKVWLGFEPATIEAIHEVENRLNVNLPEDYKEFLLITNGFLAPNIVEPTFMEIEDIDYLKNVDPFVIEAYKLPELENSILIAGKDEEQYFLLIPPKSSKEKWRYWKFANWHPGEHEFPNLDNYFEGVLEFEEEESGR